tara:strand:- start:1632 stop:2003 length:372 start_codon:yes stop_codon:yes gene_type:complete
MGQRINIQYSVDVDELDREAERLVESAFVEYQNLQADCRLEPSDVVLSYEMAEHIDEVRLKLSAIDHRLNDVSNIILGYLNYKAQENAPQGMRDGLNDLDEQLSNFKGMLEGIPPGVENEVSD